MLWKTENTVNDGALHYQGRAGDRPAYLRLCGITCVWAGLLAAWFGYLNWYANAPGDTSAPPPDWPADSTLTRSPDRPTLVMFVHPRCPCTRASIEELSRLVAANPARMEVWAVLVKPVGVSKDWLQTDLRSSLESIPVVRLFVDEDGREVQRFKATTSGEVRLYSANGALRFHGGITGARGHAGDNAGYNAICALLQKKAADVDHTFVFGCTLLDPTDVRNFIKRTGP